MDFYKIELLRWYVYIWTSDNPDKYLEVLNIGSVRIAGGSDVLELIDHVRDNMCEKHTYCWITEDEIFDAMQTNDTLYDMECNTFNDYCSKYGVEDTYGYLRDGWFMKYDQVRRISPIDQNEIKGF